MAVNVQAGFEILSSKDTGLTCDPLQNRISPFMRSAHQKLFFSCQEMMAHFFLKDTQTQRKPIKLSLGASSSAPHNTALSAIYIHCTQADVLANSSVCVCVHYVG